MKRLRAYAPMKRQSDKVTAEASAFKSVYARVDARSEGRCEVTTMAPNTINLVRCGRRGVEHHHLYRPRRSHHTEREVVHICRADHEHTEYPYRRGRLCFVGMYGAAFLFALQYAADKFQARGQG